MQTSVPKAKEITDMIQIFFFPLKTAADLAKEKQRGLVHPSPVPNPNIRNSPWEEVAITKAALPVNCLHCCPPSKNQASRFKLQV